MDELTWTYAHHGRDPRLLLRLLMGLDARPQRYFARAVGISPGHLANMLSGRRQLPPEVAEALLHLLGVPFPLLVAPWRQRPPRLRSGRHRAGDSAELTAVTRVVGRPDGIRLACDGLDLLFDLPADVADFVAARAADRAHEDRGEGDGLYRLAARHAGVRLAWSPWRERVATLKMSFNPATLDADGWAFASRVVELASVEPRVSRVDIALDYDVPRASVELVDVQTRSGAIVHRWRQGDACVIPFTVEDRRIHSRSGSAGTSHIRLYEHPAQEPERAQRWTRLEAQIRSNTRSGPWSRLTTMDSAPNPFRAARFLVLATDQVSYADHLLLLKVFQFGAHFVRQRLGAKEFRAFATRVPSLSDVSWHPSPREVVDTRWPRECEAIRAALGVQPARGS